MTAYYDSIGLGYIKEEDDPNRVRKVAWNVKRRYPDQTATATKL